MQIITITMGLNDKGAPFMQLLHSDGVEPLDGAQVCRAAAQRFDDMRIEAEVQRRMEEATVVVVEEPAQ